MSSHVIALTQHGGTRLFVIGAICVSSKSTLGLFIYILYSTTRDEKKKEIQMSEN